MLRVYGRSGAAQRAREAHKSRPPERQAARRKPHPGDGQRDQYEYDRRRAGKDIAARQKRKDNDGDQNGRDWEAAQSRERNTGRRRSVRSTRGRLRRVAVTGCGKRLHTSQYTFRGERRATSVRAEREHGNRPTGVV